MIKKVLGILLIVFGSIILLAQFLSCIATGDGPPDPNIPTAKDGAYYIGYQIGKLLFVGIGFLLLWFGRRLIKASKQS